MSEAPERDGMLRVEKKSALSFWAAAAVWVVWAILLPMYIWYHYLICAAVSGAVGFAVSRIAPPVVTWVKAPVSTGNPTADSIIEQIGSVKIALSKAEGAADDPSSIRRLITALTGIADELRRDPDDADNARRFANYYLPTTEKLAEKYVFFKGEPGETAAKSAAEIEAAFATVAGAMEKFRDSLFEGDALDISTDIDVLEAMLKGDGLD